MVSKNLDAISFLLNDNVGTNKSTPTPKPPNMSSILLIVLIIISLAVTFCSSTLQSGIINSKALEPIYTKDLSGLKQFHLSESGKSFGIIKSSRSTFIQKPPFPQR